MKNLATLLLVVGLMSACDNEVDFVADGDNLTKAEMVADQSFPAEVLADDGVTFDVGFGLVKEAVTLREKPSQVAATTQIDRPMPVESHQQGNDGQADAAEFPVAQTVKVDMLLVVDDSSSMGGEQNKLRTELKKLTDQLDKADWRVAVVTTSNSKPLNCKVVSKNDADAVNKFKDIIDDLGTSGDSTEKGLAQAIKSFTPGNCKVNGVDWFRSDSRLATFFVADEDDGGAETAAMFVDFMKVLRNPQMAPGQLKAYALIWDDVTYPNECERDQFETVGAKYRAVALDPTFSGFVGSICGNNFGSALTQIGKDAARIVYSEFELRGPPAMNSIVMVMIDEDNVERPYTDFEVNGKRIRLKNIGEKDKKVKIAYRYDAQPKFDRLTLGAKPAAGTLQVTVNQVLLPASAYVYDDATDEVRFNVMPDDNAMVKLKYRRGDELPKTFDLSAQPLSGIVHDVKVGGSSVGSFQFDASTGMLVLDEAPADGVDVKVYARVEDYRITNYAAGIASPEQVRNGVAAKDVGTGETVEVTLENSELIFNETDVVDGRLIEVTYDYADGSDVLSHELAYEPISGSVQVSSLGQAGDESCIEGVSVTGKTVSFRCDSSQLGAVEIRYQYVADRPRSFTVEGDLTSSNYTWQVFVDGAAVPFERTGTTVTVDEKYLEGAETVRVVVSEMVPI